jgi:23S rRNA U2552 (ribose-2'-O)-methylase RlmE/FtsJ
MTLNLTNRAKCAGPNTITSWFKFFPNGTSTAALTVQGDTGQVASVIRTGTAGTFTVTMNDAYRRVIIRPVVQHVTAADLVAQLGVISNQGTSTPLSFVVRVLAGATPTDITANADSAVHIEFTSINSNVDAT